MPSDTNIKILSSSFDKYSLQLCMGISSIYNYPGYSAFDSIAIWHTIWLCKKLLILKLISFYLKVFTSALGIWQTTTFYSHWTCHMALQKAPNFEVHIVLLEGYHICIRHTTTFYSHWTCHMALQKAPNFEVHIVLLEGFHICIRHMTTFYSHWTYHMAL